MSAYRCCSAEIEFATKVGNASKARYPVCGRTPTKNVFLVCVLLALAGENLISFVSVTPPLSSVFVAANQIRNSSLDPSGTHLFSRFFNDGKSPMLAAVS
jgi:hypothetical protein